MGLLSKLFRWAAIVSVVTVFVGIGWAVYSHTQASEKGKAYASMTMVSHQTTEMNNALVDAGGFAEQTNVSEVVSIEALIGLWEPRYAASQTAYEKFNSAIVLAEQQAEAYFSAQRALAERYHDEGRKSLAIQRADEEYALYQTWQDKAHLIRDEANTILRRLDDMDTDLRLLELTSGFSFDTEAFETIPIEISELNHSLDDFQIASENIRAVTKSPFEAQ